MPPKIVSFNANSDFKLSVRAESATHYVMEFYGVVGGDWFGEGIVAKTVVDELKNIPNTVKTLELHINSPGGSVTEGMAIYNRIKSFGQTRKCKVVAVIDSLCASIASVIMLAADEIKMSEAGFIMIHKPWAYAAGNADELEKMIDILDDIEEQMVKLYMKKTGKDRIEIKQMLKEETWLSVDDAVEMGFVDTKITDETSKALAASILKKSDWLKKTPKNLVTQEQIVKAKLDSFLARKKV